MLAQEDSRRALLIPIFQNNHWTLLVIGGIWTHEYEALYLDSANLPLPKEVVHYVTYLTGLTEDDIRIMPVARQENRNDCGVFVLAWIEYLLLGEEVW